MKNLSDNGYPSQFMKFEFVVAFKTTDDYFAPLNTYVKDQYQRTFVVKNG